MTSLVALGAGVVFVGLGVYFLIHPRLRLFARAGFFPVDEIVPAERLLGRLAAATMLLVGLFFILLGI